MFSWVREAILRNPKIVNLLYLSGTIVVLIWFIYVIISQDTNSFISEMAVFIIYILFGLGFLFWVSAWITRESQQGWPKKLVGLLHFFSIVISILPSRLIVADALRLPPQDFEVTVTIVAITLYPAVWALILSVLLMITFTMLIIGCFCWMMVLNVASIIKVYTIKRMNLSYMAHAFGAAVLSIWAALFGYLYVGVLERNAVAIKWVAYLADYQFASLYPGVDPSKRLRLHENGVVSYAEQDGRDVKITVGKIGE